MDNRLPLKTRPSKGWSVNLLPVRSTVVALPLILQRDHAFDPATTAGACAGDDAAETGLLCRRLRCIICGARCECATSA